MVDPAESPSIEEAASRPKRPRLPVNQDNAFWVEGAQQGKLLAQQCRDCARLRHPPAPMCGACQSLEWDAVPLSGHGTIYSYVVHHKPPMPGFQTPYAIVLIETAEGTRIVGNFVDASLETLRIGRSVEAVFRADEGDDYCLPQWRSAETPT